VAWKEPIGYRLLAAPDMCGVVIVSGTAYGDEFRTGSYGTVGSPR